MNQLVTNSNMAFTDEMQKHSAEAAKLLKNISNEQRLMILCILLEKELSVGELNEMLPQLSQSALSQHLALLRKSDLVTTRRHSQTIYYSLASTEVARIIHLLHEIYCQETC
ncbi:metalloregulator ArsR/SmtB family transcription factor [Kangiella aquimarina]|uniref:Metalloregulator ArsR/SmtB family transcription factor n=2 Tax=Kangiella aquimarina TaxID=261965 RepID=A0ABZ0X4S5_9GAMM|nr:metalloregulator ArsR/SmtB family transcription factor [Kangiella aquimarina]WQG85610.1 metalloregulator ArsR/SmtB family transcription factor [Kangiella aquimarina]